MTTAFWTGGAHAYEEGLRLECEARLKALLVQREKADDESDRRCVDETIEAIKAENKLKRNRVGSLLF